MEDGKYWDIEEKHEEMNEKKVRGKKSNIDKIKTR